MKKCRLKWLLTISLIMLCCIGCSKGKQTEISLDQGILSWKADKQAVSYEVTIGDVRVTCDEAKISLSELCEYEGQHTISVASVFDTGKKKEIGSFAITAVELEKPSVSMKESEDGTVVYEWKADENAGGYAYNPNDGYGVRKVEVEEDGMCRVSVDNKSAMTFTVIVKGASNENLFYIGNSFVYDYPGEILFDVADLGKYPFRQTSKGKWSDDLVIGTTLSKGVYDLEVSFYAMNSNGTTLAGIGMWGRRIELASFQENQFSWLCDDVVNGNEATKDTIRPANELITCLFKEVKVNKYGDMTVHMRDFNEGEMLIVTDVKLDGKSVIAKEIRKISDEEKIVYDTSKMEHFLAVYKSDGTWVETMSIPTNLSDGVYKVEVGYQLMASNGSRLTGNGMYGRRIADASGGQAAWYCEYTRGTIMTGRELPLPTQEVKDIFTVKVKDGELQLTCYDFSKGEMVAVTSVKKLSGTNYRYNMTKLAGGKNVYTRQIDGWGADDFAIETTLRQRQQIEVEITYAAVDEEGYMLTGNGMWGRRIVDDDNKFAWICATEPSEGAIEAVDTIMEPNKPVTKTMKVTVNKKGRFTISMCDFLKGESVIVTDVKYQGKSILVK